MNGTEKRFLTNEDVVRIPNPWAWNEWLCRPGMGPLEKLLFVRAIIPPGHCHPFHTHPHREEIIHVASGRAEQWVGDEYKILGPGEVAWIAPGMPHGTYNPFDEEVVFHAILTPATLEEWQNADPDPLDLSLEEPWASMRKGPPLIVNLQAE